MPTICGDSHLQKASMALAHIQPYTLHNNCVIFFPSFRFVFLSFPQRGIYRIKMNKYPVQVMQTKRSNLVAKRRRKMERSKKKREVF